MSQQTYNSTPPPPKRRSAKDYQFGATIGEGSYSTVYLALDIHNNKTFAIKVLSKRHIVKEDKIKYVNIEKTTLHRLGQQHPGIVQLYYTFQDEASLFFVLDFAEYGELLSIIRKFGSLNEIVSKFYMLQIVDAVKFIHLKGIIHRDLKPENILVGHDFQLKITDFGAAKLLGSNQDFIDNEKIDYNGITNEISLDLDRKGSFVGTAEYVAPELLKFNTCAFESDIWALGCILYQFFYGVPPFKGSTEYLTFEKIINVDYSYKQNHPMPKDVMNLIDSLLIAEPS
ncbi:Pkinase-domain-containing protein, partial [Hyphopichia burtonii NRRL Y-1933]